MATGKAGGTLNPPPSLRIRNSTFAWGTRTYVMGILNVSPDSFSGDGVARPTAALECAQQMVQSGADIIDIGGESTRPGSEGISAAEELDRVIPVITLLRKEMDVPLSVDTYKYEVAYEALNGGVDIINDIWGLKKERRLASLASKANAAIILMSNQRDISPLHEVVFDDVIRVVADDLRHAVDEAISEGIPSTHVIIDPGIGFGKTQPQNLEILRRLEELKALNYPLLVGTSRKSILGHLLNLPPSERLEATAATVAICIARGADIVRVHDVKEMWRVCRVTDAITRD
ncbi:MAG: dihydropteroate synthase [Dehalococcoidia bacterium]|nr:dihydropteroate synthase [Dehalococcoidia bacterium]